MLNMMTTTPNTVLLDDELLPGEIMLDEKVLREESVPFAYERKCPRCGHEFLVTRLSIGCCCGMCGYRDVHDKTYVRKVKLRHG